MRVLPCTIVPSSSVVKIAGLRTRAGSRPLKSYGQPLLRLRKRVGRSAADGDDVDTQGVEHVQIGHGEHLPGVIHFR